MSAALELQAALHARLAAAAALTGLLGGAEIHDGPRPRARYPFVAFGDGSVVDYGGLDADAFEHRIELDVWTRKGGRSQGHEIASAVAGALDGFTGVIGDHRLVNLIVGAMRSVRMRDGVTVKGTLDVRAVTEPV